MFVVVKIFKNKSKGFLFGVDALLVLVLISSLPLLTAPREQSSVLIKQSAGYTYLNLSDSSAQTWLDDNWVQHDFDETCSGNAPFVLVRNYSHPEYLDGELIYFNQSDASYTDYYEVCVS